MKNGKDESASSWVMVQPIFETASGEELAGEPQKIMLRPPAIAEYTREEAEYFLPDDRRKAVSLSRRIDVLCDLVRQHALMGRAKGRLTRVWGELRGMNKDQFHQLQNIHKQRGAPPEDLRTIRRWWRRERDSMLSAWQEYAKERGMTWQEFVKACREGRAND